jgi:hypothetical protein
MSFLAPLYIAGLVALSLPILFHLIRRAPQGRQAFSSLMFLSPSPPRLTRRSRLTNIVLLLLRAAALALLALAFARPFFPRKAEAGVNTADGRRVAILVDTSASMRRPDLWAEATKHVERVLRDVGPADEVGLYFFDRRVRPAMTFAEWNDLEPSSRAAVLRGRVAEASPSWAGTNAGDAIATVADLLAEAEGSRKAAGVRGRQLVLISDLQQGSHMEALQGHQWPQNVLLDVRPVVPKDASSNASLQLVRATPGELDEAGGKDAAPRLRVRITNQAGSEREQFALAWAGPQGPLAGAPPVTAYAPPGRSQVVRVPRPAAGQGADRLVLSGDDTDFDNTLFVVPPRKETVRVVYVGDDAADDVNGLRFYFERAVAATPQRTVELVARGAAGPLTEPDLLGARLVVVAAPNLPAERAAVLRRFAETGGDVLWVLTDAAGGASLASAMQAERVEVREAPPKDFALLGRVDTEHPLFAPFANARLGDFTKIHFWKHRSVTLPKPAGGGEQPRVLAAFDDGDPFLIEQPIGRGRLLVMTSGWHPADSQLALSTKFVPLLDGFVRARGGAGAGETQYTVGDTIPLPEVEPGDAARLAVERPDKTEAKIGPDARSFDATDQPGIYRLGLGDTHVELAVNVAPDESRTAPLAVEDLERWGARVGNQPVPEEIVTRERQLQRIELESRQKVWQWLIIAVLALLAAETALAGGLARRAQKQQVTA